MSSKAPWTQEQVDNINRYQKSGVFHEFTCPGDSSSLIATKTGLICEWCDFEQNWVNDFMLNFTQEQLEAHPFYNLYNKTKKD